MEYEYTEMRFKMPSDALIEFEKGTDLYVIGGAATYIKGDIYNIVGNHMNLFTRKEKEIDYQAEFTLDTTWMVSDDGINESFAYALTYDKRLSYYKFRAFYNSRTSIDAYRVIDWKFARHLTKEEEIEYLGVK